MTRNAGVRPLIAHSIFALPALFGVGGLADSIAFWRHGPDCCLRNRCGGVVGLGSIRDYAASSAPEEFCRAAELAEGVHNADNSRVDGEIGAIKSELSHLNGFDQSLQMIASEDGSADIGS